MPARNYAETPNVPNQHDPAPRFGLAYDLFGNGKTALKFSINRYNASRTTGDANSGAQRYNPLARTSITLNWTDLNKDDIAQGELGCVYLTAGCEINLSGLPSNFGFTGAHHAGSEHRSAPGTSSRASKFSTSCCRACR